jgi:hypothetical protein
MCVSAYTFFSLWTMHWAQLPDWHSCNAVDFILRDAEDNHDFSQYSPADTNITLQNVLRLALSKHFLSPIFVISAQFLILRHKTSKTEREQINSVALVRKWSIPTERPPLVGEVSAKFADRGCNVVSATDPHGRYSRFSRPRAATFPFK